MNGESGWIEFAFFVRQYVVDFYRRSKIISKIIGLRSPQNPSTYELIFISRAYQIELVFC
jgi:hypothetical protein